VAAAGSGSMLGFDDVWVGLAYVLCVASALVCVVYSWTHWNSGNEAVREEDIRWAEEEDKMEEKL
jgi:hypothetical protein